LGHKGIYDLHLSFRAVVLLKVLAIESMPRITVKLPIVDYSRQWSSAVFLRITKKCTRVRREV